MPYSLELHDTWDQGLWLVGVDDLLPEGALRLAQNVRTDRILGALTNRPGSIQRTSAAISATLSRGRWLSSLFGTSTDYRYAQVTNGTTSEIFRFNTSWGGATSLLSGLSPTPVSDVNWLDGNDGIWKYLVGPALRKDNGTTLQNLGIVGPTNPPSQATLGTRRRLTINNCNTAADWTGSGTGAITNSTTTRQDFPAEAGGASITFTVAASTLGSVAASLGTLDLDSFDLGILAGTATGGSTRTLIDTTQNFRDDGVVEGMLVELPLGGQRGTITAISTTTNTNDTLQVTGGFSPATAVTAGTNYTVINDLVKDDDYIYLWVRVDVVERVEWMQVDFDLDTATVADAFRINYYTIRIPGNPRLNQGRDVWTELKLRKSEFLKLGPGTATWSAVRAVRVSFQTTSEGPVTLFMDDLSLVGGYGIEGEIQYTTCYENVTTGCRSNPPLDGADPPQAIFTIKVKADRHPIQVSLPTPSADSQVNRFLLYRKGGALTTPRLVARLPIATTTYEDVRSDTELAAAPTLELDNNPPPSGAVVVAGPGAYNRLFYLVEPNRVYVSKAWEVDESRAEQVPTTNFFLVGDGSQVTQNLYVQDTTILAWTTDAAWRVLGQGSGSSVDLFLPVAIPQSRGLAARFALTAGDGRIFLLARDGVYQQVGLEQTKLTGAVDPLFEGQTVNGVLPLNLSAIGECRLQFFASPQGGMLVLLYPQTGSTTPNRALIIKKNRQSGQYTDCFIDTYGQTPLQGLYGDYEANELLAIGSNARVYRLDDDTVNTDDGTVMDVVAQTKAYHQGLPRHEKSYLDVVAQANTASLTLTATAYYNLGGTTEALGTVSGTTDISQTQLTSTSTATRRNIALRLASSSVNALVKVFKVGWHWLAEAEDVTVSDSDEISFATRHVLRHLFADYEAAGAITLGTFIDGATTSAQDQTLAVSTARIRSDLMYSNSISTLRRGLNFRFRLTSTGHQLYGLTGVFEPEPQRLTWFDTRLIPFATRRVLRQLFYEIDAPAAITISLYLDGSTTVAETKTLSATTGRQRVDQIWSDTAVVANLRRGHAFQVTLSSASAFQLWSLTGAFEIEPLQQTFWDSRELTFEDIQNLYRYQIDADALGALTVTTYIDGTEADSRGVSATTNRQRVPLFVPAGLKGRSYRVTLSSTSSFQVYGLTGEFKAWGGRRGWQSQSFFTQQTELQQHSFMQISTQLVERPLLQVA